MTRWAMPEGMSFAAIHPVAARQVDVCRTRDACGLTTGATPMPSAVSRTLRLALLVAWSLPIGCGSDAASGPTPPAAVASISLTGGGAVVWPATAQLQATVRDAAGHVLAGRTVAYTSRSPAVATVSAAGLVASVDEGSAVIVATCEGLADSVVVAVTVPIASVSVSALPSAMTPGDTLRLTTAVTDAKGAQRPGTPITWATTDAHVLAVTGDGLVTAGDAGHATVTASAAGVHGDVSSTVVVRFVSIEAAYEHTCALTAAGEAYCWGKNHRGQLGDGTVTNRDAPVRAARGLTFTKLRTASYNDIYGHTCGIVASGAMYCWGDNENGELGDPSLPNGPNSGAYQATPVPVSGGLTFTDLGVSSNYTCGLATGGTLYCWGYNGWGQLGRGTKTLVEATPTPVNGGLVFTAVSTGYRYACGLVSGGAAYCWGQPGGQLGVGDQLEHTEPTSVSGALTFQGIAAGAFTTCAVATGGDGYCWGFNGGGQVGDGTTTARTVPTAVAGGLTFESVSTGGQSCGITTGHALYCWGLSGSSPAIVSGPTTWLQVSAATENNCGIGTGPLAYCWGSDTNGQLGNGSDGALPAPGRVDFQP